MRLLGISALLLLAATALADPFGPPTQFITESVPYVAVASTTGGPVTVWTDGAVKANGLLVASEGSRVDVASIGSFALVVWRDAQGSVKARRLRPDGVPSGVERLVAGKSGSASGPVAVAAAGDRYLVAWAGPLGAVYAAIVTPLGDLIVPAMPVTTQSPLAIVDMSAAASGDGFAIVWDVFPQTQAFAVTLRSSGVAVSMTPLVVSDDSAFPDVTSDGNGFFVVWGTGTIYARTLTLEGELGRVRTVTTGIAPRVAWDGFVYGLAFAREVHPRPGFSFHQLFTMRISVYGTLVEQLTPESTLVPRAFDIAARTGRLDLAYSTGGVTVQSAAVGEPRTRIRALRH